MVAMHRSILIFIDWFDPGYKAGGPIRSAVNVALYLQRCYNVYVFTSDRDLGSSEPYKDITPDKWVVYDERVKVMYCSPASLNRKHIHTVIKTIAPHYIYLNSLFSRYFTIYPLLINKFGGWKHRIILAPRGMLRNSALQYKAVKKKLYLHAFRWLSLHKHISFQATDDTEFYDVKKNFGESVQVLKIPDFPAFVQNYPGSVSKTPGEVRIIFVGRIHPIKNLDFLLERLMVLKEKVLLTVIGSEEDKEYVGLCRDLIASLPANIIVRFEGEMPNHKLHAIIAEHHIFALPTKGENFGHAIFEGLSAGKPVLISDQTPWRELIAVKAGWDISLADSVGFEKVLQQVLDMGQEQYDEWSKRAWEHAYEFSITSDVLAKYNILFQ